MLFSEPKIPQYCVTPFTIKFRIVVSVLFSEPKIPQLPRSAHIEAALDAFQCSSASRKFLNESRRAFVGDDSRSFSALQRAENSSIFAGLKRPVEKIKFQCSSASRKFLNSALGARASARAGGVSVLFSEPKIPQYARDD